MFATKSLWYEDGLRFTCTQCGNCCTGPAGYVWFTDAEAEAIAGKLNIDVPTFRRRYARRALGHWTLDERLNDRGEYDCVFLQTDDDGRRTCQVYDVRPLQCRTWPFWPENLREEATWRRAARTCPGMTNGMKGEGRFYSVDQIRIIRDKHRDGHE